MKTNCLLHAGALIGFCFPAAAFAQNIAVASAPDKGAATIYRQVMPNGRIVYSDKVIKGGKLDHTITIAPPIKGNSWTTESGQGPAVAPQIDHTPVNRVAALPAAGKKKTPDEANSDVIRAEMFLEDAKKRQQAGLEPLPGERTGTVFGHSRLNEEYQARQRLLAKDVAYAEAALKKAIADRNGLR